MIVPLKWFWFAPGLLAIVVTIALRWEAFEERTAATAPVAGSLHSPAGPPSTVATTSALSKDAGFRALAEASPTYTLDPSSYIPAPWYGDEAPEYGNPAFSSVEIGDVTGDARNDVVAVGLGMSPDNVAELLVYAQRPDGTLASAVRYPVETDYLVYTSLGDFNEDGVLDVVVAGSKNFMLFTSGGDGRLIASTRSIYDPVELGSLTPAMPMDVNLDGHLDLVFLLSRTHAGSSGFPTVETHSRLVIQFGDGLGGFAGRVSFKTYGISPYDVETGVSLAAGDLNQDGIPDLAIRVRQFDYAAQRQRQLVRVYLNDQGRLVPAYDLNATMEVGAQYSSLDYIAIGDFNQDGRNDLAGSPGSMDMRLWVLHQSTSGRFDLPPLVRRSEPIGLALEVADLDRNGSDDLLVAHDGWARVTYHLQSAGQLGEPENRQFNYGAPRIDQTGLAVGDINGDGCADAALRPPTTGSTCCGAPTAASAFHRLRYAGPRCR